MCSFVSGSYSRQLQCKDNKENIMFAMFVIMKDVDQPSSLHRPAAAQIKPIYYCIVGDNDIKQAIRFSVRLARLTV